MASRPRRPVSRGDGGILAALSANASSKRNSSRRSIQKSPPRTLVLSGPNTSLSLDDDDNVSLLASPKLNMEGISGDEEASESSSVEDSMSDGSNSQSTDEEEDEEEESGSEEEEELATHSDASSAEDEELLVDEDCGLEHAERLSGDEASEADEEEEEEEEEESEDIAVESDYDPAESSSDAEDDDLEVDDDSDEGKLIVSHSLRACSPAFQQKAVPSTQKDHDQTPEASENLPSPLCSKSVSNLSSPKDQNEIDGDEESSDVHSTGNALELTSPSSKSAASQPETPVIVFALDEDDEDDDEEVLEVMAEVVDSDDDQDLADVSSNGDTATDHSEQDDDFFDDDMSTGDSVAQITAMLDTKLELNTPKEENHEEMSSVAEIGWNENNDNEPPSSKEPSLKVGAITEAKVQSRRDYLMEGGPTSNSTKSTEHTHKVDGNHDKTFETSPAKKDCQATTTPLRKDKALHTESSFLSPKAMELEMDEHALESTGSPNQETNGESIEVNGNLDLPPKSPRIQKQASLNITEHCGFLSPKIASNKRAFDSPVLEKSINRAVRFEEKSISGRAKDKEDTVNAENASKNSLLVRREGSVQRGKWKLGSKIGSGAFGVVHMGMNTHTGALMAVKSIRMEHAVLKDVRREVDLLRSLKHKNIVLYHGAEMDAKYLHIFQEWVPGGSITGMLCKFGAFPISVVRNYLAQILEGLAYLHSQNVMHRDLKGSNVLINDNGIVKLADFGASKRIESLQSDMMMSLTMRGTPYFMAPEVFEEKYSTKADIWGVGCVAVQMISGTPPWKNLGITNPVALFRHVQGSTGPPDTEYPKGDTETATREVNLFKTILSSCFDRDPEKRPNAVSLAANPFFTEEHISSDDNDDHHGRSLFSPSPSSSKRAARSPLQTVSSPARGSLQRRNSIGCMKSPLMSPPVPKHAGLMRSPLPMSPKADPRGWPTWAREKHQSQQQQQQGAAEGATSLMDSLAYSDSTKSRSNVLYLSSDSEFGSSGTQSQLMGLDFLST